MTHITDLPLDMFYVIFLMIAKSDNGARDLLWAGATCRTFMKCGPLDTNVLKVVNFQQLTNTDDFSEHHNVNDLLCFCAAYGNQEAQYYLGKALLNRDRWFWNMILVKYQQAYWGYHKPHLVPHHHSLVRKYIRHAPSEEVADMLQILFNYVIMYAGYKVANDHGLLCGIINMCTYEEMKQRFREHGLEYVTVTFGSLETVVGRLEPSQESLYRDTVIELFDKVFPSARA